MLVMVNHDDDRAQIKAIPVTSQAARLRKLMPDIVEKIDEGASHEDILSTLRKVGFQLTMSGFRSQLTRYRRKHRSRLSELVVASSNVEPSPAQQPGTASDGNGKRVVQSNDASEGVGEWNAQSNQSGGHEQGRGRAQATPAQIREAAEAIVDTAAATQRYLRQLRHERSSKLKETK